ncbi:MAG: cytochrome c-type biogenesis CcmF C-terminal domain-containing protein, partial [Sphingomicrobium sp.]
AARIATVREGARFALWSREGGLVANNLLLSVILGIVFVGTLYPLLAEAMTGEKLSVGPPYFNSTAGPLALILIAFLLFAPLLRWRHDARPKAARIVPGALAAMVALGLTFVAPVMTLLSRLTLALAGGLAVASLLPLARRNLLRTPLATWGMAIAHFGVAVALAGIAVDSSFTTEKLAAARPGETLVVGPWSVTFASLEPIAGPNWTALEARLDAVRGDTRLSLTPQARTFSDPPTETSETAIATLWDGQLYTVLGKPGADGRWQLRLWWKPFVTLIWLGGALIALGGILALLGRLWRDWRRARGPRPETASEWRRR